MSRWCQDCGSEIMGRSDKKFCGDACRSNYHNKRLAVEKKQIYSVNTILRKNRRILMELIQHKRKRRNRQFLLDRGFDFSFYTHMKNEDSKITYYCYDLGYKESLNGVVELVLDHDLALSCK